MARNPDIIPSSTRRSIDELRRCALERGWRVEEVVTDDRYLYTLAAPYGYDVYTPLAAVLFEGVYYEEGEGEPPLQRSMPYWFFVEDVLVGTGFDPDTFFIAFGQHDRGGAWGWIAFDARVAGAVPERQTRGILPCDPFDDDPGAEAGWVEYGRGWQSED